MRSWRVEVEPHATAWRELVRRAREIGLVHALDALDWLRDPSDCAALAADMVADGVLEPIKVDMHHARYGSSLRAFRGLQYRRGTLPTTWSRGEAHLFTYQLTRWGEVLS